MCKTVYKIFEYIIIQKNKCVYVILSKQLQRIYKYLYIKNKILDDSKISDYCIFRFFQTLAIINNTIILCSIIMLEYFKILIYYDF